MLGLRGLHVSTPRYWEVSNSLLWTLLLSSVEIRKFHKICFHPHIFYLAKIFLQKLFSHFIHFYNIFSSSWWISVGIFSSSSALLADEINWTNLESVNNNGSNSSPRFLKIIKFMFRYNFTWWSSYRIWMSEDENIAWLANFDGEKIFRRKNSQIPLSNARRRRMKNCWVFFSFPHLTKCWNKTILIHVDIVIVIHMLELKYFSCSSNFGDFRISFNI